MRVRISYNQGGDRVADPICVGKLIGKDLQCYNQRNGPQLTDQSKRKPLIESLGEPCPEQQLTDKKNIGRNGKKICLKRSEAE